MSLTVKLNLLTSFTSGKVRRGARDGSDLSPPDGPGRVTATHGPAARLCRLETHHGAVTRSLLLCVGWNFPRSSAACHPFCALSLVPSPFTLLVLSTFHYISCQLCVFLVTFSGDYNAVLGTGNGSNDWIKQICDWSGERHGVSIVTADMTFPDAGVDSRLTRLMFMRPSSAGLIQVSELPGFIF